MKGLFDTASASLSAITEERSAMESYIKLNSRSVGGQVVVFNDGLNVLYIKVHTIYRDIIMSSTTKIKLSLFNYRKDIELEATWLFCHDIMSCAINIHLFSCKRISKFCKA